MMTLRWACSEACLRSCSRSGPRSPKRIATIDEQAAAIDEADAAIARVRELFMADAARSAQEAPGRARGVPGSTTPAEPSSPAGAPTSSERPASRECLECEEPFTPARHGGQAQKFCGKTCRQRAHKRRQPQAPNGTAAGPERGPVVEPVPDNPERPFRIAVESNLSEDEAARREAALRPPAMPWEQRA
jgi:hypothetical protein